MVREKFLLLCNNFCFCKKTYVVGLKNKCFLKTQVQYQSILYSRLLRRVKRALGILNTKEVSLCGHSKYFVTLRVFWLDKEIFRSIGVSLKKITMKVVRKGAKRMNKVAVYITTKNRVHCLKKAIGSLFSTVDSSTKASEVDVFVFSDESDGETLEYLLSMQNKLSFYSSKDKMGLPFMFNMILDHNINYMARMNKKYDFFLYLQDDTLLSQDVNYLDFMIGAYQKLSEQKNIGIMTGFYTPLHPGFKQESFEGRELLITDSIDGKNFFTRTEEIHRIGKVPWLFEDGLKKGNPGPVRGSHFDLWLWKESPSSTSSRGKVNLCFPGLVLIQTDDSVMSTWNNKGDESREILKRVKNGRVHSIKKPLKLPVDS